MDEDIQEGTQEEVVETNPVEEKARSTGWVNQEEWTEQGKNPDDWVSAEVFVARAPMIERIEKQGKLIKRMGQTLEQFKQHYTRVEQASYEKALATLKQQRREALEAGELAVAEDIRDRMDEMKQTQPRNNEPPQEFLEWMAENPWYEDEPELKDYADFKAAQFAAKGVKQADLLPKVEEAVKKRFKEHFSNPMRQTASAVETGGRASKPSATSEYKLTPEQRSMMNKLIADKVLTKEEYIRDIKLLNGE